MTEQLRYSKILKRSAHVLYVVALIVGVIFVVISFDFEVLSGVTISIPILMASVLLGIINRFWMVLVFLLALGKQEPTGSRISRFRLALSVFGKTWMSRYFPVKGAWIAHRLTLAGSLSVSKTQMAATTSLESFTQFFGMATLASALVLLGPETVEHLPWLLIVLPALAALFLYLGSARVLKYAIGLLSRLKGISLGSFSTPRFTDFARLAGAQVLTAILSGASTALVVVSIVGPLDLGVILFVVGVTALINLLSVLAFFSPAGIGVREGAFIIAFQTFVSFEVAVVIAVLARMWSLAVDLLFFLFSQIFRGSRGQVQLD